MKQFFRTIKLIIVGALIISCIPHLVEENTTPTIFPTSIPSVAFTSSPQTYTDPDGWLSISIPLGWKSVNGNSYVGEDGFLEIGYLPEDMAYLQNSMNICQWIANIETKSIYFIQIAWLENYFLGCSLMPLPDTNVYMSQVIIENPFASFPKKLLNIKMDVDHHDEIMESFVWLRPTELKQESLFEKLPMRPTDVSFWKKTTTKNEKLKITEYELPQEAQNLSPTEEIFLKFIPSDIPVQERLIYNPPPDETWEDVNKKIKPYGYELVVDGTEHRQHLLYKNGELWIL